MVINEIRKKTRYYVADLMLEDCLSDNGEIDFDKALKKILSNDFVCGICDWEDGIELKDVPKIFVSSDEETSKEDLEDFIRFIKTVVENGKGTETYSEYSQLFEELIKDCENYEIIDGGYNEHFSIKIFENFDLTSIISEKYRKQWK